MQLELRQESEPINTILLIFTQFRVDLDWHSILLDFRTIKQLTEEFSFRFATFEEVFRETRGVRKPNL